MAVRAVEFQDIIHERHRIVFAGTFPNFATHLPTTFEKLFPFRCSANQTFFKIRVDFQRVEAGVDCHTLIHRHDHIDIRLDGGFWVKVSSTPLGISVPRTGINFYGMPRYAETTRSYKAFIPNDILARLGDADVLFKATVMIQGCHGESDSVGYYTMRDPSLPHEECVEHQMNVHHLLQTLLKFD